MAEEGNKKFSTREWWMFIVLIVLIQWLIHFWSTEALSSSAMVNYVSFAGTLVSTILAVLAIIYSFIQSANQQTTSETISREVHKLQEIVSAVDASTSKVNSSLERLPAIVEHLEVLPHALSDTVIKNVTPLKEQSDDIMLKVSQLTASIEGQSNKSKESTESRQPIASGAESVKANHIIGVALAANIISKKKNYSKTYESVISTVPEKHKPYFNSLFLSALSVLAGYFVRNVISVDYVEYIERGTECKSDAEWADFISAQNTLLINFLETDVINTHLNEYIPSDVKKKVSEALKN